MMDLYGYRFADIISRLRNIENSLNKQPPERPMYAPHDKDPVTLALRIVGTLGDELDMTSTKDQVNRTISIMAMRMPVSEMLIAVRELGVRISEDGRYKKFLFLDPVHASLFGSEKPFGDTVYNKFPETRDDIKMAGNCLALGQATACVFHLGRALETVVKKFARRFGLTVTPKTTWRVLTNNMNVKISKMPDATERQMRNKNAWESACTNLHLIGSVWRNSTMHPATSYTPSQARDIREAARVFMNDLCAL